MLKLYKSQKISDRSYRCMVVTSDKNWVSARPKQKGDNYFRAYIHYPAKDNLKVRTFVRPNMLPQEAGISTENMEVFLELNGEPYKAIFKTCIKGNFGFDGFECDYTSTQIFEYKNGVWTKTLKTLPQ